MSRSRLVRFSTNAARPEAMVRRIGQTTLDATELAVRSCLDSPVRGDGSRCMAHLAPKQPGVGSDATLLVAIAPKRCVVERILPFPGARMGFPGNYRVVVRHICDRDCIWADGSHRWLADDSVLAVGQLCGSVEFRNMEIEHLIQATMPARP